MTWQWALRELWRRPVRTLLSVAGVAISGALVLDMVMLSGGIERSFEALLLSRGYQLRVSPKGTLPFDTEASIPAATALVAELRTQPGVAAVAPVLGASLFARRDTALVPLVAYGVDPDAQGLYDLIRGEDLASSDGAQVLLGEPAAALLRLAPGDTLVLTGQLDPGTAHGSRERAVTVRGTVRFIYDARDQPSIALPLAVAQQLSSTTDINRISVAMIRAADGVDPDVLATQLAARFPTIGINSVGALVVQFRQRLTYFRQLSFILGSISLIVCVLLVGTLLAVTVNERIGEIAALRAIGIRRSTVIRHVIAQGVALVAAGGAVGLLLGLITARGLDHILTSFPGLPAAISFFVAEPKSIASAAVALLCTGAFAGALPAWRAARAPIATTLREEAP